MDHGERSLVENPYFARECFEDAKEEIAAAQKIAREIARLSPDLRFKKYTEPKVLVVGGFVRDALSGDRPKDLDLEVSGVPIDKLIKVLRKIFGPDKVNEVGKSFGVFKVSLGNGRELDVAIPRVDSKDRSGGGHKNIKAKGEPALSIKEAQRRRDFTINALGMEVLSGSVIDSFGGVEDLKNKVLRLVDKETFKDDPLRVLRGVQFAARFGLTIESKTFAFMKEMVEAGALDFLPADRIRGELEKLFLKSEKPSVGLEIMRELGIVERYFPELHALIDRPQDPEKHSEGDVWTHTKLAVDLTVDLFGKKFPRPENMSPAAYKEIEFTVVLATLLLNVEKPATVLNYLNVSNFVSEGVLKIIELHRIPDEQLKAFERGEIDKNSYIKATKRLLDKLGHFPWPAFLVVCESDFCARGREVGEYQTLASIQKLFQENKIEAGSLVSGRDVLRVWEKIKGEKRAGGTWVGELIRIIREEGQPTRKAALARLEEIIRKKT